MSADPLRRVFWGLLGLKVALSVSLLFGYLWLMPLPGAVLWPLNKAADGGSWG